MSRIRRPKQTDLSRRAFLTRVGGLTLSLGVASLWRPRIAFGRDPYALGVWLAGDHHIHTKFSPDGQYDIVKQVAMAAKHGLGWCVITDHGGPMHDRVALKQAYPELLEARKLHPEIIVFQGMEWNVPAAEHGSVILPPTGDEARQIAEFERRFDEKNLSKPGTPADAESDAVAAVKYLEKLKPKPLFFANHPARRGRNSPIEMRNWSDSGPNVTRGFEGAPGHQAETLIGAPRGGYDKSPKSDSWPAYPKDSYRTWGGFDWYVTQVGGLWDSLLGEGRPWYITANSDSHRHHTDLTEVNPATYLTHGHVTPTTQKAKHSHNGDFWPGEYTKTWVHSVSAAPMAVIDALRSGNMFPVHGGLIDRLELTARTADAVAPMGGTLMLDKPGEDVEIRIRMRVPDGPNFGGLRPQLNHIDLISGDILGPAASRETISNPTTKLVARIPAGDLRREGGLLTLTHLFPKVRQSFYVRIRGTNRDLPQPEKDKKVSNPWEDLWFYSNPVMIRIRD
jgi:hypothetical protein